MNKVLTDLFSGDPRSIIMKCSGSNENMQTYLIYLFIYFEQYLFRGAQFSEAGLNGALTKRKKTTQKKNNR